MQNGLFYEAVNQMNTWVVGLQDTIEALKKRQPADKVKKSELVSILKNLVNLNYDGSTSIGR